MVAVWLFGSWLAPADLGAPEWPAREAAAVRCKSAGLAAYPFLDPLRYASDPETRYAAGRLLLPLDALLGDVATAKRWLLDPVAEDDLTELELNADTRRAAARALQRLGLLSSAERRTVEADAVIEWLREWTGVRDAASGVRAARARWEKRPR